MDSKQDLREKIDERIKEAVDKRIFQKAMTIVQSKYPYESFLDSPNEYFVGEEVSIRKVMGENKKYEGLSSHIVGIVVNYRKSKVFEANKESRPKRDGLGHSIETYLPNEEWLEVIENAYEGILKKEEEKEERRKKKEEEQNIKNLEKRAIENFGIEI